MPSWEANVVADRLCAIQGHDIGSWTVKPNGSMTEPICNQCGLALSEIRSGIVKGAPENAIHAS